jgi:hypothetical protein
VTSRRFINAVLIRASIRRIVRGSAAAAIRALGARIGDPIIGLAIPLVILKITWDSWRTVTTTEPGELVEPHEH